MNVVFRTTVIGLIRNRVDALSDGNDKKAREYQRILADKGIHLGEVVDTPQTMCDTNLVLAIHKSQFDPKQVTGATRIERWDTLATCSEEFTVHALVGANGRNIGHRIIEGY